MTNAKQQGAVLIVSLIMLTILTLYGLSSSNNAVIQVDMTSTDNNARMALNAAESALTMGVLQIEKLTEPPQQSTDNIYMGNDEAPVLTDSATWANTPGGHVTRSLATSQLITAEQAAQYFIVYLGMESSSSNAESCKNWLQLKMPCEQSAANAGSGTRYQRQLFRIIAMGTGPDGGSQRIVEAFYRKVFIEQEETP